MLNNDNRKYIRYPSDIPLQYTLLDKSYGRAKAINNISLGGLSFNVKENLKIDSWLTITINLHCSYFNVDAKVCWCRLKNTTSYDIGVDFSDDIDAFSVRMIEQLCYIECYRKKVFDNEGRELNSDYRMDRKICDGIAVNL